jgi:redox-sensitive bicupin YhaK (pirin superfamily)
LKTLNFAQNIQTNSFHKGEIFKAVGLRGSSETMSPFLMADHFYMSGPVFGPHPHAGFSAVTYMFEDSQNSFLNKDSLGNSGFIHPGDLHWSLAGSGLIHDEYPQKTGVPAHGLQIFVNHVAAKKHMPPEAIHVNSKEVPNFTLPAGSKIRVPFGKATVNEHVLHSPAIIPTHATLIDVHGQKGEIVSISVEPELNAFVFLINGHIKTSSSEMTKEFEARTVEKGGGMLQVSCETSSHFVVFLGAPIFEPLVQEGPFAMNTREEITAAIERYRLGEMGSI